MELNKNIDEFSIKMRNKKQLAEFLNQIYGQLWGNRFPCNTKERNKFEAILVYTINHNIEFKNDKERENLYNHLFNIKGWK